MLNKSIKNFTTLANSPDRSIVLGILEAGIQSIETKSVVKKSIQIKGEKLDILGTQFDLSLFKKIKIVGFGKASVEAAQVLEEILGSRISSGAVIGLKKAECRFIETFAGSHPKPSAENAIAGKKIFDIVSGSTKEDLIIVLVSGGGSALLCASEDECNLGSKLYESFLASGGTISEMNTVRKHLSVLKGGGLAKLAYPATIIGLIFSDVPGDNFADVASGPTYFDHTTIMDAAKIIKEKKLGDYALIETPKDPKYFTNVHNFILVSNEIAVRAMEMAGKNLGLNTEIVSTELYDLVEETVQKIFSKKTNGTLVLAAGEPKIKIVKNGGVGGRNMHLALSALRYGLIKDSSVFASFASDGLDNSDMAGAIVDKSTLEKIQENNLDIETYYNNFDSYNFFKKTGDLIETGPTGANVSDLMVLWSPK